MEGDMEKNIYAGVLSVSIPNSPPLTLVGKYDARISLTTRASVQTKCGLPMVEMALAHCPSSHWPIGPKSLSQSRVGGY